MSPWHLRRAADVLDRGGIVAHPTEGVWGLACDPLNEQAVSRLLHIKQRSPAQGLILIAHDYECLMPYLGAVAEWMDARVLPTWPGPVTWVLPAASWVPEWLTGGRETIAVRVTAHPVAAALSRAFGDALVSTSANISGRPAALNSTAVYARIGGLIDYLLAGKLQTPGKPSQIRDAESGALIRAGAS